MCASVDSWVHAGVDTNVTVVPVFVSFYVAFLLYWADCQVENNMTGKKLEVKGRKSDVRHETGGDVSQREQGAKRQRVFRLD